MDVNLVTEAIKFMVLGMTTVFLFLILMIYILKAQAYIIQKYFSDTEKQDSTLAKDNQSSSAQTVLMNQNDEDAMIVAAITAAISEYRKK